MPPRNSRKTAPELPEVTPQDLPHDDTSSASDDLFVADILGTGPEDVFSEPTTNPDEIIDAEVVDDDTLKLQPFGSRQRQNNTKAKTGPPTGDEWLDFFSRIVIRFITEWYADMAFHGIDEDIVSEHDAAKLLLTQEERDTIARPFAEFANRNPYLRKHGRQIVAFADSFESMVILGQWFTRVNRLARKYKRMVHKPTVQGRSESNGDKQQGPAGNGHSSEPITGIGVFNPGSG
jgi:hypothetical protein